MAAPPDAPLFHRTTLANGIRVVTETIPSVRSVAVGVWVQVGSRDERPEEAGIAHFIEHVVFKGTAKRRTHHIAQRMEAVGGYLNAFTSKEYTCFYARALDEHLERALDTTLDLVLNPAFPEKEVEREKDVVLEEMKMYEDQPEDLVFDRFERVVYGEHALGQPVIGFPETVRAFTREQVRAYVERHYTPDRMVVAIAGNVDHRRAVRMVERLTAGVERRSGDPGRTGAADYVPGERREGRPIQQAHLVIGTRSPGLLDDRRTTLSVLNTVLGGGMSSRLSQNIRERYGYCYNVYSFANLQADAGDFGVYIGLDAEKVDRGHKLVVRELEKLAAKAVSPRQLQQAKSQLKGSIMLGLESMSNRMMRLGRIELTFGRYFTLDEVTASIDAVSADDVRGMAEALFPDDQLSSVALVPQAVGGDGAEAGVSSLSLAA